MEGAGDSLRAQREAEFARMQALRKGQQTPAVFTTAKTEWAKFVVAGAAKKHAGKSELAGKKELAGKFFHDELADEIFAAIEAGATRAEVAVLLRAAFGRIGGIARAAKLLPEQRREIARKAGKAPRRAR